MVFRGRFPNAR